MNLSPEEVKAQIIRELEEVLRNETESITRAARSVRRQFSRRLRDASPQTLRRIAHALLRVPSVPKFVAYELICHHQAALSSLTTREIERLGDGLSTWGDVDAFACYVAGPSWREGQITDKQILLWANSRNPWRRRAALVSTVALNSKARGGKGDVRRTLLICGALICEREEIVVKALSWALRELAKREPAAVDRFLKRQGETVASRVRREVRNKLATGLKNPGRRS